MSWRTSALWITETAFIVLLLGWPGVGLAGMEEDITRLRTDMAEMKKDVAEIKKLLQGVIKGRAPALTTATVSINGRPTLGKADAPVTIIEFSDYQCPYCQRFATTVFPKLKEDYIDTGKVRYVFRDFPLAQIHPQAAKAHEGAHCAGEHEKYWEMHDVLFQKQKDLSIEALKQYAQDLGLDAEAFGECLDSGKYGSDVRSDLAAGAKASVRGTPTFIIGKSGSGKTITGTLVRGAQPLARFQQVIAAVQKTPPAKKTNAPTTP